MDRRLKIRFSKWLSDLLGFNLQPLGGPKASVPKFYGQAVKPCGVTCLENDIGNDNNLKNEQGKTTQLRLFDFF